MKHLQFTARISGTTNTSVTWSASGGTISSSGLFTAPQVTSATRVSITATSPANHVVRKGSDIDGSATSVRATVTVMPAVTSSLAITNSALPTADAGVLYSASLSAIGGAAPYQWTLASGILPSGIQLQTSSGVIAGKSALPGLFPFSVQVTDASGHSASAAFSLTVAVPPVASTLAITNSALPAADVSISYSASLSAIGGLAPYHWNLISGLLPIGIQLQTSSGVIAGRTALSGSYPFSVQVTDASGHSASAAFSLRVAVPPVASTLAITNSALPAADVSISYAASLSAIGGLAPYHWNLISGLLPFGIQLQTSSGVIAGRTALSGSYPFSVQVTDASGHSASAAFSLTVAVPPVVSTLAITNSALPAADASTPYTASLSAVGGLAPYHWNLLSGILPSGIQLHSSSGIMSGMTAVPGSYPVSVQVSDASGHSATAALSLTVSPSSTGSTTSNSGFDGPAELPRVYMQSAMSNTPAPGKTITVNSGGNLQSALNSASCGDTIKLEAGATFVGIFTFPAKNCDDNNWIIVRTSDDSLLPAEGSRLTPCYAGVTSLPARPALQCASTNNVLAKLVMPTSASGPIIFASGANYYRLTGLEVTRAAFPGPVYNLVLFRGAADHVVFDRLWLHGTAQGETARGIGLEGTNIAIVDSSFTDFHCISVTGSCSDAQAIAGGGGNDVMGPYKIVDNFLEASGENIIFGGGAATLTPADIEIRQNHFFKPLIWMKGQAGHVGATNGNPFIVKNLLELKNAQRVLVEGNIMDYSWGGFSQAGFAILLTPKNQAGVNGNNLCPVCQVTDVTIRYNLVRHVGDGLQIANALSDNGGAQLDGQRYSIHDLLIDDLDGKKYYGASLFAQISVGAGAPLLQNVTIDHVTAFPSATMLNIGNMVATNGPMRNFVFTNNILSTGTYPVWSTGGGPENCAYFDKPIRTLNACFSPLEFAGNLLIGNTAQYPSSAWPSKNFVSPTANAAQLTNYNGGIGGNYGLLASSPYKGKGTDGKDPGADVAAINSAIAGVD
ncbi:MAG TPA: Ig domain-containing protein [Candidatus Acidoferrum sp.]|nr:Ig domain-containing protein [Candidatus Acidoferrum sp.]